MRPLIALFVASAFAPGAAHAQPPQSPVSRIDVAASTGWFTADRSAPGDCCSSGWSAGLFKGVSAGYYWTDHLKTEVGIAAPGTTEGYAVSSRLLPTGLWSYTSEEHHFDGTKVSIAQVYQFGRNSTFHPFIVGGVDIDRERDTIERYVSVSSSRAETTSEVTSTHARGFAGAGFKAYFSERAFFRGEARFGSGQRTGQMLWTAGVGVDLDAPKSATTAAQTQPSAAPPSQEPAELWRQYASGLQVGATVDVKPAGSDGFTARLMAADADGILVKPLTRVPEPARHVAFDRLEMLALHDGPRPGTRVGATLLGVGTGAGVFLTMLFATLNHFGG